MKKFLALLLALVMTMSLVTVGASAKTAFTDDKDITEVEAVEVLSAMGIIDGYKDGSFKPQGALNRAAGAKFIAYLMLGEKNADGLKATGTVFEDVAADYALAPYVEWCAKMGIVDGYGDGKFGPTNTLTQAAFGKMLLTALGYDSAKEGYTGAGWQKAVYADGLKAGVYGDDGEIFAACNRETAAKLALGALKATMVEYGRNDKLADVKETAKNVTKAASKVTEPAAKADTLQLWETYDDLKYVVENDNWGRPGHTWEYGDDFDEFYADEAVATYTVATSYCDICKDLGESKKAELELVFTNGKDATNYKGDTKLTATATSTKVGAQGQLVEIYDGMGKDEDQYRVVVIDTYLAQVTDVTEKKLDKNDHVKNDAYLELAVYIPDDNYGTNHAVTYYVKGNDFEEDDYILVNVNDKVKKNITGFAEVALVEIVGAAKSFEGEQTKIKTSSDPKVRIIDDTDYSEACQYELNYAKARKVDCTWFLDQYGNVIGSVETEKDNVYGVLTDLIWVVGKPGHAEGSIKYVGETGTLTVEKIGDATVAYKDSGYNGGPISGKVSDDSKYNKGYEGIALFKIETNSDDESTLTAQTHLWAASLSKTAGTIIGNGTDTYFNTDTKFIVREGKGTTSDPYTYADYTSADLPDYADGSMDIFYVNCTAEGKEKYANIVYIKDAKLDAEMGTYLFTTEDTKDTALWDAKEECWYLEVVVDGEKATVAVYDPTLKVKLCENEGKLFTAGWRENVRDNVYGYLNNATLVNEANDSNDNVNGANYIWSDSKLEFGTLVGGNKNSNISFVLTGKEVVVRADGKEGALTKDDLKDNGVWVVADNKTTDAGDAKTIYIGTALSANVGADVTITDNATPAAKSYTAVLNGAGTTFSATLDVDKTMAGFTATAKDVNAKIINKTSNSFTVVAEDGVTTKTYAVTPATSISPTTGSIKYTVNFYDKLTHVIESTKTFTSTGLAAGIKMSTDYPTDWILGEVDAVAANWTVDYVTPSVEVVAGQTAEVTLNVSPVNA